MDKQSAIRLANLLDADALKEQLTWKPFREGIEISPIYDSGHGASAAFLRYAPGASVPRHEHTGWEHILVLQGSQDDDDGHCAAGSLLIHGPGTSHAVRSEEGCIVLAVWEQPVRFDTAE
jgi:anti-sigma factor ChrR (cupin superfamily)